MSVPVWCADLASAFWKAAGEVPPFPRDLLKPAVWFGLPTIELPGLRLAAVFDWLAARGCRVPCGLTDRPLRGCLFAERGRAFAFLDANDDAAERRFSLAHELSHFLRDYWRPREAVKAKLGSAALAVMDGLRKPTHDERLQALLRHVTVGPFTHLLRRDESGRPLTPAEREAEAAADRLAFELLAPEDALGDCTNRDEVVCRLVCVCGLPTDLAERYAAILVPDTPSPGPLVARFRVR